MTPRVKQCACGCANSEHDAFCAQCGQPILDLVAVAPAAPASSASPQVSTPPASPSSQILAPPTPAKAPAAKRICPLCGTANEAFALLCDGPGCGNDLSAVTPSGGARAAENIFSATANAPAAAQFPTLRLTVGTQNFECRDGDIIGREGTIACQIFSGVGTVSRRHVTLTRREQQWFVTVLPGVQNITQLDGRELPRGTPHPLTAEHTLKMSTQCEVKLKVVG